MNSKSSFHSAQRGAEWNMEDNKEHEEEFKKEILKKIWNFGNENQSQIKIRLKVSSTDWIKKTEF
jgi:hypothetical protein